MQFCGDGAAFIRRNSCRDHRPYVNPDLFLKLRVGYSQCTIGNNHKICVTKNTIESAISLRQSAYSISAGQALKFEMSQERICN
jgi:hypothetical protein